MVRFTLCAAGLALAARSVSAGHGPLSWEPADQTGLFQIGKGSLEESTDADGTELGELGEEFKEPAGYVPEDYKEGELVETKVPDDGKWVLAAIQGSSSEGGWDVKVPGGDLHGVPAKWLRRRLLKRRDSDWLVVDKGQLSAEGVAYRRSKDLTDVANRRMFAPFDTLVVGSREDGWWVNTSRGYLPMLVNGVQVLAKRDRKDAVWLSPRLVDWYLEAEEARRQAALAKADLELPPPQRYDENDEVLFQTSDGSWAPARVAESYKTTYKLLVRPAEGKGYVVPHAVPEQLRKTGPPKHGRFVPGESKACQRFGGCIELLLKDEEGNEHKVPAALGKPLQYLVKSVCTGILRDRWSCESRLALWRRGRSLPLPRSWRTFEAGLANGDVVDMTLAPASTTYVGEHSIPDE